MALNIATFSNNLSASEQNALSKAFGHPLFAEKAREFVKKLKGKKAVSVFDPNNHAGSFDLFYGLSSCNISNVYVQKVEDAGHQILGKKSKLVDQLFKDRPEVLVVAAFDAKKILDYLVPLLGKGTEIITFDEIRLPDNMLTDKRNYLAPINFATNFGFMREKEGHHTRITLVNYWAGYGAKDTALWLRLFDESGKELATWEEKLTRANGGYVFDSKELSERFGLGDFTGSLFIHAIRIAGHDIVKYVVDTYGNDREALSCTHDANSWPADFYAGLPAPANDEKVVLWVQNSHPIEIPKKGVGLSLMGSKNISWNKESIPPFASAALDVSDFLPKAKWPQQLEVHAGRYFVRPRYEIFTKGGRSRIAHANVERTDLKPDPKLAELKKELGKGFILPMPILPIKQFETSFLPTPMATCQQELPLRATFYDGSGKEITSRYLGRVKRDENVLVDVNSWLNDIKNSFTSGYGHAEFSYDFSEGSEADGWLHAIARFRQKSSQHEAETSFGAHIYNIPVVYKGEPQSYAGKPPGLSTRLALRIGKADSIFCHLIYPASKPWLEKSSTALILHDDDGKEVDTQHIFIPCGGSNFWRYEELFPPAARQKAGRNPYVIVRDTTCRLFGFHGMQNGDDSFCLDHMFGF